MTKHKAKKTANDNVRNGLGLLVAGAVVGAASAIVGWFTRDDPRKRKKDHPEDQSVLK